MFVSAALSGVVGGLIAAGFLKMDGLGGWEGWRYLFAIEGGITILIGVAALYFIADGWQSCRFLTPRQKLLMKTREVQAAQFIGNQSFSWLEVRKAFT
jgi:MFS family permease